MDPIIEKYREEFIHTHNPYSIMSGVGVGIFSIGTPDTVAIQKYYDELLDLNIRILSNLSNLKNVYFLHAPFYYRDGKQISPPEYKIIDISKNHETIVKYLSSYINGAISYDSKIFVYEFIQDFAKEGDVTSYITRYSVMGPDMDIKKWKISFWENKNKK
jgi:hypothetical protein